MSFTLNNQQISGIDKIEIVDSTGPTVEATLEEISTDSTITPEVLASMKSHGSERYSGKVRWNGEIQSEDFGEFGTLDANMKNNTRRQVKVYEPGNSTPVLTLDNVLVKVQQTVNGDVEAQEIPYNVNFSVVAVHQ